ncbi:MAG: aminotransferase class V-fold PLP-dependent enzyme [Aggregatilineales bacterium]
MNSLIYLDNAATSWPKPPEVTAAMTRFLSESGANPGRSGHRMSIEAARIVYSAREAVAELINLDDPLRVIFGHNATEALNLALYGLLRPGDHVVTSTIEHNAVMRPLRDLEQHGVVVTVVACAADGTLDPERVTAALRPETALIVVTHASNVTGTLLPVAAIGQIARQHGALLLVDAAQTAGAHPIDLEADAIDLLAFTGHKALLGPMGTGGLAIGPRVDIARLRPLKRGGTGSRSEEEEQPDFLPDRLESGTPNAVGLAGLAAGIGWIRARGLDALRDHERRQTAALLDGLEAIDGVTLFGPRDPDRQTATIAFAINGLSPSDAGLLLDEEHGVLCRVGLHCAPAAHRTFGTFPRGTIRFSAGVFTTGDEIERALAAVRCLARKQRS